MRVSCGPSPATAAFLERERVARLHAWHPFFPWRPRRVGDYDCRWLEWIERRKVTEKVTLTDWGYSWEEEQERWEYRLPQTVYRMTPGG